MAIFEVTRGRHASLLSIMLVVENFFQAVAVFEVTWGRLALLCIKLVVENFVEAVKSDIKQSYQSYI